MESMGFSVRYVGFDPAAKDVMFDIQVSKGRTSWTIRRPEASLKWMEERMRARKIKNVPKYKPMKQPKKGGVTDSFTTLAQANVETFLCAMIACVTVENIPAHMPLRSWFEIDEEGRHGLTKAVSGINQRALCVVRATCDYVARDDRELSLNLNDVLSIVDNSDPVWWRAKMGTRVGLVAASMVEVLAQTGAGKALSKEEQIVGKVKAVKPLLTVVRAEYDYAGDGASGTLTFAAGETIGVTDMGTGDGWWEGTAQNGKSGWFPASFCKEAMGGAAASSGPRKVSASVALELELSGARMPSAPPASSAPPALPPPRARAASAAEPYYPAAAIASASTYDDAADDWGSTPTTPAAGVAAAGFPTVTDPNAGTPVTVLYDFAGDGISLAAGDTFYVGQDHGDGWVSGWDSSYAVGYLPISYVQRI